MNLINIEATTLPDAWFQCLWAILEHGREFKIDEGSYAGQSRLEFDWITIRIKEPWHRDHAGLPLIPSMPEGCSIPPPVAREYLPAYAEYLLTCRKLSGEDYTYGNRLWAAVYDQWCGMGFVRAELDQVKWIVNGYKQFGHRNNQLVLQIAQPDDLLKKNPPCLRHIDTRVQDNKLHFFIYFRSWDLWGGMPANLAGISMLHEYMANEIGVDQGEFICTSKGLHLYDYAVELAKMRCGK